MISPEAFDFAYQRVKERLFLAPVLTGGEILACLKAFQPAVRDGKPWKFEVPSYRQDIEALCAVESEGIEGAILGRSLYEGAIDFKAAQVRADELGA